MVHESVAIAEFVKPLVAVAFPAAAIKPLALIFVIVYELTLGELASFPNVTPIGESLHTVSNCATTTGSGLTVTVTVKLSP